MSLKETSERIKKTMQGLTGDVRGITGALSQGTPRPIADRLSERPTLILHQPLLKTLREKRKE